MSVRHVLRWSLFAAAGALALVLLASVWLARSNGGRDWLLARAIAALPPGASLRWDRIDGSLSGPLEIHGLHYQYQGSRFDAQRLRIDHAFWPLLSGRLDVHRLTLEHAAFVMPVTPLELPRWPALLPTLDMPLTVAVTQLQVRDLQVREGTQSWLRIASLQGGFTLSRGALDLRELALASDRGRLRLSGGYRPRDNFRTTLDARLVFPAVAGAAPAQATLTGKGDIDDFLLALDGHAPAPLSLRLRLRDGRRHPQWRLDTRSAQLSLAQLGIAEAAPLAFELQARSAPDDALQLQGRVAYGDWAADIAAPSRLRVNEGVLSVEPLSLRLAQGPLALIGTVVVSGMDSRFDVLARSDALQLRPALATAATPAVTARGQLRLRGRWRDWTLAGAATLHRAGKQASVTLAGRGSDHGLVLERVLARTPDGSLRGAGEVHWQPPLGASLQARLTGFDPGYFLPDYPGALSGDFDAKAQRDGPDRWQGELHLAQLRGRLRQRPVSGRADLHFADGTGAGALSLRIGSSQIEAAGSYGDTLDLHAQLSPLELSDLWPDASGRLQGTLAARGTRQAPAYSANLRGERLQVGDLAAGQLSATGQLPAHGNAGDLRLSAADFSLGGEAFARASLALTGSVAAFRARADLAGELGAFTADLSAAGAGQRWQGRLERLQLAPARGAAWRLQSAADFRYAAGVLELARACLRPASSAGELCAQAHGTQASVQGRGLPLTLAKPWLVDSALALQPFGQLDFDGEFVREPGGDWTGHGQLHSPQGGLRIDPDAPHEVFAYSDLQLGLQLRARQLGLTLVAKLAQGGHLSGRAQTGLSLTAPLQGELQLDVRDLTWMELLSTDLATPRGDLTGTLQLFGQLGAPELSGDAHLAGFTAELPALGVTLRAGDFRLRGDPGGQTRLLGSVSSGKGELRVDGSLNLRDPHSPLQLSLRGEDITVAATPDLDATMSPELTLRYADGTLQIRGEVTVPTARVDLERLDTSVSPSADVVVLDPREPAGRSAFLVDTDVQVKLGAAVQLHGFGLDGTLGGSLRIVDRPDRAAQATGTLEVAGKYKAYGRALDIRRGRLTYVGSAYDNPELDIVAEHEFEEVTVGVRVRGSARAPETTVTSSPAMATGEALSWLVLGRPLSTASGAETQQVSASALALSAGSNLLAQQLGSQLGLDTAGITESRALGGSALLVGKQVSPRLFVSYGISLIGTGQVLTLKYLLAHGLNVSLESGNVETAGALNWRKEK